MPKLGDPIPLLFQLHDGDTGKHVRAILRDIDGNALPESPVTLTHVGNGAYQDSSVAMPDTEAVKATYEPFDDAGFTQPSSTHTLGSDIFSLVVADAEVISRLQEIKDLLDILLTGGDASSVEATIEEASSLLSEIIEELSVKGDVELEGEIESDILETESVSSTIDQEADLTAEIKDCDD